MHIRPYVSSDLEHLKRLTTDGFVGVSIDHGIEERFGLINSHDWRWRKARHIDEEGGRDAAGGFFCGGGGRVVGYVTTWQDCEAGIGNIPNVVVAESHRNQGLGRALIEHALSHFRAA